MVIVKTFFKKAPTENEHGNLWFTYKSNGPSATMRLFFHQVIFVILLYLVNITIK